MSCMEPADVDVTRRAVTSNWGTGLLIGLVFGLAIGWFNQNAGLGILLGAILGPVIGWIVDARR